MSNANAAASIIRTESFAEAAMHLAEKFSGTYSVLRAPNVMAELWMEMRIAPIIGALSPDFLADYEEWKRWKRDDEGGFVLHVLVDAFVPECMMGVVLAHIDENHVTDRAWMIPSLQ